MYRYRQMKVKPHQSCAANHQHDVSYLQSSQKRWSVSLLDKLPELKVSKHQPEISLTLQILQNRHPLQTVHICNQIKPVLVRIHHHWDEVVPSVLERHTFNHKIYLFFLALKISRIRLILSFLYFLSFPLFTFVYVQFPSFTFSSFTFYLNNTIGIAQ